MLRAARPSPGLCTLLLALALVLAPRAHAATVANLYSAVVPVADRSQAESDAGVARALALVLVKVTGRSSIVEEAAGRALLGRAGRYVTVIGHETGGNDVDGWRLRVDFDAPAVAGALRERGVVLWGQNRPQTEAWVLIDDAEGRRFVPEARYPALREVINTQAAQRAIPLARGRVDAALAATVAASAPGEVLSTIVGGDAANAAPPPDQAPAARPVQAPRLAGIITPGDGLAWQGRWRIVIDGQASDWETSGESPDAVAAAGIDRAADALARHFANPAVFGGGVAAFALTVQGIATPGDYGRALSLLRGLDAVTAVGVQRVTGNEVLFALSARGGLPAVTASLRLTSLLQPVAEQPGTYLLAR